MPDNGQQPLSRQAKWPRYSLAGLFVRITLIAIVLAGGRGLYVGVQHARDQAISSSCSGRFCQLIVAMHNYHDHFGCFPPAVIRDEQGRPLYSWRVALLPYLDQQALYGQFDLSQPWDSPRNLALSQHTPMVYCCPGSDSLPGHTSYVVITGADTLFPPDRCSKLADIQGREDLILFAETSTANIVWTEPRDLDMATMSFQINDRSRPSISSTHFDGARAGLARGCSGTFLRNDMSPAAVRSMIRVHPETP